MPEPLTEEAHRSLVLAQEQAQLLHHNFIGTEHLLLGLLADPDGVAGKALDSLGISIEAAREKVAETTGPAGSFTPDQSKPFTPRARKVLLLSVPEAKELGHNYVGTEHILLGLIREGEGVAAQILINLGAELSVVRDRVMEFLDATGSA
jgi:ATP-dependent Clp protease ATP-binding subunit ClpC